MGDDNVNVMSLLTGGADVRIMVKEFIKKYKGMILLIVLLIILGGWAWMASKGFSLASIAYTFLGVAIVVIFLLKMFMNWLKESGSTGGSGDLNKTPDDVLIDKRIKKQQEIDELDVVLDERAEKLRSDAKKITKAKKGQSSKQAKKKGQPSKRSKESADDGSQV